MITPSENVRQLIQWNRYCPDVPCDPVAYSKIHRVGIIGAGVMGSAIAAAHLRHRIPVVLCDLNQEILDNAPARIAEDLASADGHRFRDDLQSLLQLSTSPIDAAQCDLIIESIVENLPAKQRLYSQLWEHLSPLSILTSNTSTIPLQRLTEKLPEHSRFCGFHFFHPVRRRALAEIARTPKTAHSTVASVVVHARKIRQMPILVQDGPGFVVNRLLFPYLGAALELLRDGVPADSIEKAATDFGMAMGPLQLMDEIGLDTTLHAGWVLAMAFPERIVASPLLVSLVKAGRLGTKSGGGFFSNKNNQNPPAPTLDPDALRVIQPWMEPLAIQPNVPLIDRLMLPMLAEAIRILEEGKIGDPREIDLAVLFGLGFPMEKGGLLYWAAVHKPHALAAIAPPAMHAKSDQVRIPLLHSTPHAGADCHPANA